MPSIDKMLRRHDYAIWLFTVTKIAKTKLFYILRRNYGTCLILVPSTKSMVAHDHTIVGASMKRYFYIQIDVPIGNFSPKLTRKYQFSLQIG